MGNRRSYSVEVVDRCEGIIYSDEQVSLYLEQTHIRGHRIYCDGTARRCGSNLLSFDKRREIIENLCEAFESTVSPLIFVIDEADKDREALEELFCQLRADGHRITVEHDSEEKRQQFFDAKMLQLLKAGKTVEVNGTTFHTPQEYRNGKRDQGSGDRDATRGTIKQSGITGKCPWWKFW